MARRRGKWLRARRWRAFFRVAGVFPWLFAAGVLATGALFAETLERRAEQAAREAAAKAAEARTPVPALTLETLQAQRSAAFALLGVWLPRALWTGVGLTSVVAAGVLTGLVFRGGGRTADPAPRRRHAERPACAAKSVREHNVGEPPEDEGIPAAAVVAKPKSRKPKAAEPGTTLAPPKPGTLPPIPLAFDEHEVPPAPARKPAAPPKKPAPPPAPVSKRPKAPSANLSDDDRLEAMY